MTRPATSDRSARRAAEPHGGAGRAAASSVSRTHTGAMIPTKLARIRGIGLPVLLALLLAACGGGGGSDPTPPTPPADTTPPTITVTGDNPLVLEVGDEFEDPGATASDAVDGTVEVTVSGTVDVDTPGDYTLTYSAADAAGNRAEATRVVRVADGTPPEVTVTGDDPLLVELGSEFVDPGATATDAVDGELEVAVEGNVDVNATGDYTLTYVAVDAAGNRAEATRVVRVVDAAPPVLTLLGGDLALVELGEEYFDAGATATDAVDGDVEVSVEGAVDVNALGEYTITIVAVDSAGNRAEATRTVRVTPRMHDVTVRFFGDGRIEADSGMALACEARGCSAEIEEGTSLTLSASANPGWSFSYWEGCDAFSDDSCTVAVAEDMQLFAYFQSDTPVRISSDVMELSEQQMLQIERYDADSGLVVFAAGTDVSTFQPGRILVTNGIPDVSDDGARIHFGRRIERVVAEPGVPVLVETSVVTLGDVIEAGTISIDVPLGRDEVDVANLPEGITLAPAPGLQARVPYTRGSRVFLGGNDPNRIVRAVPTDLPDDIERSRREIPLNVDLKIDGWKIAGTMTLLVEFALFVDIERTGTGWWDKAKDFLNAVFGPQDNVREAVTRIKVETLSSSLQFSYEGGDGFGDTGAWGRDIPFAPIPVWPAPPVWIQPEISIDFHRAVALSTGLTLRPRPSLDIGLHYVRDEPLDTWLEDVSDPDSSSVDLPEIPDEPQTEVRVEAGPEITGSLLLYSVAGPGVTLGAHGILNASTVTEDSVVCGWQWGLVLKAFGGVAAEIDLKVREWGVSAELVAKTWDLANGRFGCEAQPPPRGIEPLLSATPERYPDRMELEWSYDYAAGVDGFRIYRARVEPGEGERQIESVSSYLKYYVDYDVEPNTLYCYRVAVRVPRSPTEVSSQPSCRTTGSVPSPPGQPLGLRAEARNSSTVYLTWDAVDGDVIYDIGYSRDANDRASGRVDFLPAATNSAYVTDLEAETRYCFRVVAVDRDRQTSPESPEACLTTPAALPEWTLAVGCRDREWLFQTTYAFDDEHATEVSVVGTARDYDGDPVVYLVLADHDGESGELDGEMSWALSNDRFRVDAFKANLGAGDSGVVQMTQQEPKIGCDADIRFFKGEDSEAGAAPAAYYGSGSIGRF